jgi:hypothetical protein
MERGLKNDPFETLQNLQLSTSGQAQVSVSKPVSKANVSQVPRVNGFQALLATWTGTCSVCGQPVDAYPERRPNEALLVTSRAK